MTFENTKKLIDEFSEKAEQFKNHTIATSLKLAAPFTRAVTDGIVDLSKGTTAITAIGAATGTLLKGDPAMGAQLGLMCSTILGLPVGMIGRALENYSENAIQKTPSLGEKAETYLNKKHDEIMQQIGEQGYNNTPRPLMP